MAHQNTPTTNPIPLAQARRGRGVGGPSRGQDRQVVPTRGLGTSSTSRIARPSRNNQVAPSQGSFFTGANDLDINGGQFNMTRGHHTNLTINFNQGGCVDIDEAELGGDEERRQANNVSVRTPEQAIRVPDEQRQPWRRPSLPVQKSCDIYYRHLSVKGRGSPLWVPEPNTELPLEYQRRGISIGDVGIITDYGGFDFLFNICLPPGHPINPEDLPENFAPLNPPLRPIDVRGHSGFRPGSYLSSGSVERSRDDSDPFGLTFETTESEGAILTMPQGSKSRDLGSVVRFRKYMSANAEDWYRYVHDVRGREARNGDVRLVVGWDQTTTWGMATFTKTAAQNGIRLKFGPMGESSVGRTYGWQYAGMAEVRAGPDIREIEELRANDPSQDDIVYRNQCLFIRTLNATLDNDVWDKLVSETDMTYVQNDPSTFDSYAPSSFHPTNPSGSTTDRSTSNPGGQSGARGASRMADTVSPISTQSVHVSDLPTALAAHPSKVINEMLLKERPNAKMAITEDNDWISVISQVSGSFCTEDIVHLLSHIERLGSTSCRSALCTDSALTSCL
ncbi:hypothetical protein BDZ97DRAFT_1351936 [Flammula alnicola]|nr:hypothetical protein BDZ97DRAFT_1351936 [Flammula alnicola]